MTAQRHGAHHRRVSLGRPRVTSSTLRSRVAGICYPYWMNPCV
ncbi:hypothetical protein GQ55_1G037700 [Panicum hallii var. hallii]|uniref:Uncharacterized protein n=1 Tax=Panicum hallii var. hallii TaxID=1504633 RepID=A0A2T7F1Z0_9POAL|nr:hypothetical protein GQ55_1G037700 [Panicum hallii var. hallii]